MAQALRKIEPETRSYSERIIELRRSGQGRGSTAIAGRGLGERLRRKRISLTGRGCWPPAKVLRVGGGEPDFDQYS